MSALTLKKLEAMLWKANRRSRAKSRAAASGFPDNTECIEAELVRDMRPHFAAILRLAIAQKRVGTRNGRL